MSVTSAPIVIPRLHAVHHARALALACLAALVTGCASPPRPAPPPEPAPAARPAPTEDPALALFRDRQAERARQAEADGRWADAELAWEVIALMQPGDPAPAARLDAVKARVADLVAERRAQAEAAQRRSDLDAAAQAWLDVLALAPTHATAADALRQIERERERRRMAGRNARVPMAKRVPDEPESADLSEAGRRNANLREHAALLARQGDVDGAVALLREPARTDAALRAQLADLYVARAESLRQRDPIAARAAVDAALALDRKHAAALALVRQLPRAPGRTAPAASATGR